MEAGSASRGNEEALDRINIKTGVSNKNLPWIQLAELEVFLLHVACYGAETLHCSAHCVQAENCGDSQCCRFGIQLCIIFATSDTTLFEKILVC